jgi:hypothetical protein
MYVQGVALSREKSPLEVTHFSVDMFIVLGLDPCVTKGRWENGKREKHLLGEMRDDRGETKVGAIRESPLPTGLGIRFL